MNNSEHKNAATELSSLLEKGYSSLLSNSGKVIAAITATVCALVTFTDITFGNIASESFTSSLLVMLLSSYLIYFSLESTGEKFGEGTEEYRRALECYDEVSGKIDPDALDAVREFCTEYARSEGDYRRSLYLASHGLTKGDLIAWRSGKKFAKAETRALKKAEKILPKPLTPMMLLSSEGSRRSELDSPERSKLWGMLARLIPSTLGTLFTVSVMLTAKEGLTAGAVIEGILKLSALPIIGFKGYTAGYEYVKNKKALWLRTKTRILEGFLASRKERQAPRE